MKKKITFLLMFVLSLSISSAQNTFRFGTSATPEGKTLLVDSKGLILDGKHIIPVKDKPLAIHQKSFAFG